MTDSMIHGEHRGDAARPVDRDRTRDELKSRASSSSADWGISAHALTVFASRWP